MWHIRSSEWCNLHFTVQMQCNHQVLHWVLEGSWKPTGPDEDLGLPLWYILLGGQMRCRGDRDPWGFWGSLWLFFSLSSFCYITRIHTISTWTISAFCLGNETGPCSEIIALYVVTVDVSTQLPKETNHAYIQNNTVSGGLCSVFLLRDISLQRNSLRYEDWTHCRVGVCQWCTAMTCKHGKGLRFYRCADVGG